MEIENFFQKLILPMEFDLLTKNYSKRTRLSTPIFQSTAAKKRTSFGGKT